MSIRCVSAVTFLARDPGRSIEFYRKLGFVLEHGGPAEAFTTLRTGEAYVNLIRETGYAPSFWGRVIFRVDDVDALHRSLADAGVEAPAPEDAPWGERYFHLKDPDGHELSFAQLRE